MEKIILESVVNCDEEDGGCALIAEIGDMPGFQKSEEDTDAFFVRLQSWDDNREHKIMNSITGKKVRVTIEVIN